MTMPINVANTHKTILSEILDIAFTKRQESTPTWYPPKVSKDTKTGRYNLSKISRSKVEEKPCWQITY